jgi:4-amino-4-deoxy-L-arabinose transferase-like glycosyltransferase
MAALAFVLRVCARLYMGGEGYFTSGYSFFFDLAQNIAAGKGIGFNGDPETFRVPFYSIVLAAVTMGREAFVSVVIVQSLIGAGTVWCAARLAREMFGAAASVVAAAMAAIYPYYIVHDTALGETSLFTLLTAVSVILLLRARKTDSGFWAGCAGVALGVDVMTRATIAPFAALAPLGLAWLSSGSRRQRIRMAALCALAIAVVVSPWLVRSYILTGSVVLSTETGFELWNGNNEHTFSHYPNESIDRSAQVALATITPDEWARMEQLGTIGAQRWYRNRALEYVRDHPWLTVGNGFRKLGAAFGWFLSPRHGFWVNMVHALSYGPVMLLGLWGMWMRRARWREDSIIYAAFVCFAAVTAAIFGHTSHRVYLDVYWIAFAAGALSRYFPTSLTTRAGA